jgi:hypothetical protein
MGSSTLRLTFIYSAEDISEEAFALPLTLSSDIDMSSSIAERLVLAECKETRLTVNSPYIDFGACIIPSSNSMRSPYEADLEITNMQGRDMQWFLQPPSTDRIDGCKQVFSFSEDFGMLGPHSSKSIKVRLSICL